MEILALALLRIPPQAVTSSGTGGKIVALEDAVLLHTGASFATEPEELTRLVRDQLGDTLVDAHGDPRGIFYVPSVVRLSSRAYEAAIAEVADGGVWGPSRAEVSPFAAAAAGGSLGALLGNLLEQMPSSVLESAAAVARAQPGALEAASAQLKAAVEQPGALDLARLGAMLESSGIDMNAMQALVGQMQAALESDPARTAALAEQFFGASTREDDSDDADDDEER